jgi:hypothetical protein
MIITSEINKMAFWFRADKLAVNINKTKYIIFRSEKEKLMTIYIPDLVYNDNEPGVQNDPNLIKNLERYHNNHTYTTYSMSIYRLTTKQIIFVTN